MIVHVNRAFRQRGSLTCTNEESCNKLRILPRFLGFLRCEKVLHDDQRHSVKLVRIGPSLRLGAA